MSIWVPGSTGEQTYMAQLGPVRYWPERGLICWEDARDNSYSTISVADARERAKAFDEMVKNSAKEKNLKFNEEFQLNEVKRFLGEFDRVLKKAEEQGMPDDPNESMHNAIKASRPTSVLVPSFEF